MSTKARVHNYFKTMNNKLLTGLFATSIIFGSVHAMEMNDTMAKDMGSAHTSEPMMKDVHMASPDSMKNITEGDDMYSTITTKSSREDIAKLQMMLVEKGHLIMPTTATPGYYGPLTMKAFKKYKKTIMMKDISKKNGAMMNDSMKKDTQPKDSMMKPANGTMMEHTQ